MRWVLLLLFLFVSCSNNCPKDEFRRYRYGDEVKVIAGFYKGSEGIIISRGYKYKKSCAHKTFEVRLNHSSWAGGKPRNVNIEQEFLYVEGQSVL